MGETRDQRLAEFVALNPTVPVFGLPEGDWLRVRGAEIMLNGPFPGKWFVAGSEPMTVEPAGVVRIPPRPATAKGRARSRRSSAQGRSESRARTIGSLQHRARLA